MNAVRAICLDLDDTLWEIAPVIGRAERILYKWLSIHYPRVTERFGIKDIRRLRASVVEDHPDQCHDLAWLRRETYRRLAERSSCSESMADDAFAIFQAARNEVELFDDVVPALRSLRRQRVLYALTNGNACLHTIGLADYFAGIYTAAELGMAKPDPAVFREVSRRSGLPTESILHVGDDPHLDVMAAREAGMQAVWMNRRAAVWPDGAGPPAPEVHDLHELLSLLELR